MMTSDASSGDDRRHGDESARSGLGTEMSFCVDSRPMGEMSKGKEAQRERRGRIQMGAKGHVRGCARRLQNRVRVGKSGTDAREE